MSDKCLFIVFWNEGQPTTKAVTAVLELESDQPSIEDLGKSNSGTSLRDLFQAHGISVKEAQQLFPGKHYIVPRGDVDKADWDSPFAWLTIPHHPEGIRPLANRLRRPVHVRFGENKEGIDASRKFTLSPSE